MGTVLVGVVIIVLPAACCLLPAACCLLPAACCLLPAVERGRDVGEETARARLDAGF
ncbi:hypothetical protein ACIOEX_15305 [Streptomyces sp. NPDC087850]|uniref:hypothetical protein n=1 Tax=Streptomyces sp. NPDC087850 TaxID=3365809 RepID=UPI0037F2F030